MHNFAREMLEQLTNCRIMSHLEDLFDKATGYEAEQPAPPAGLSVGKSPSEVASHPDIVGAIRTSWHNVRPDHPQIPPKQDPSYQQLRDAVTAIPRSDKRKLHLRFHPDKFASIIGRQPSEVESELATSVMQVLLGLCNPGSSERDIVATLKKLESQSVSMMLEGDASNAKSSNMDEVKAMLSKLSI